MGWDEPPVRRKRRWVGLVIALAVFLALVSATAIIGEKLARDWANDLVGDTIGSALELESDAPIDVDFGSGSLILQALGGSLDGVRVTADSVPFGSASAQIVLTATTVPIDLAGKVETLAATVVLDENDLLGLGATLAATPITSVDLVDGALQLETTTDVGGQVLPAIVTLSPAVSGGSVAFTVTAITINGDPVDVAQAQAGALGPAAALAAAPRSLCLAQYLPAALTLSSVTIAGDEMLIGFIGTDVAITGGGLGSKGSCE